MNVLELYNTIIETGKKLDEIVLEKDNYVSFFNLNSFLISIVIASINGSISMISKKQALSINILYDYFWRIIIFGLCIYLAFFILLILIKITIPLLIDIIFTDKHSKQQKRKYKNYFYQNLIPKLSLLNECDLFFKYHKKIIILMRQLGQR